MGVILPDAANNLTDEEHNLLRAFTHSFDVTWARTRRSAGSDLSVCFLKPEPHMHHAFGLDNEVLALYSKYETLEPRSIQALAQFASESPAKGRVDPMIAFLISESIDPAEWLRNYTSRHTDLPFPIIVPFTAQHLRDHATDPWLVRQQLTDQLYQRDLFDHRLPIQDDRFFVGRDEIFFDLCNAYAQSANRGLFGLRKTGKTSLFFKLRRFIQEGNNDATIYLDCKNPGIRTARWHELLDRLVTDLTGQPSRATSNSTPAQAANAFQAVIVQLLEQGTKVVLMFDEIEYITPYSLTDEHWSEDFVPFWQTLWSVQSITNNLSVFIGGVNPAVVETAEFDDVQNPLFGLVSPRYVAGMTEQEIRNLLRTLGRPLGLRFGRDAAEYISKQYGGHPLLSRIACSYTHRRLRAAREERPYDVGAELLRATESDLVTELAFYAPHITSELQRFYPDEFEVLTEIANGNLADMWDFVTDPTYTSHLKNYGLLRTTPTGRPVISIAAFERALRSVDRDGRRKAPVVEVQPVEKREFWLRNRKEQINHHLQTLESLIDNARPKLPSLFGPNSYPRSREFFDIQVVTDESDFQSFINVCNLCFVESIDAYGRSNGSSHAHKQKILQTFPELSDALDRIRLYRHSRVHLKLDAPVNAKVLEFRERDLTGLRPTQVQDLWFTLQQRVLDELLNGILIEIDKLS